MHNSFYNATTVTTAAAPDICSFRKILPSGEEGDLQSMKDRVRQGLFESSWVGVQGRNLPFEVED